MQLYDLNIGFFSLLGAVRVESASISFRCFVRLSTQSPSIASFSITATISSEREQKLMQLILPLGRLRRWHQQFTVSVWRQLLRTVAFTPIYALELPDFASSLRHCLFQVHDELSISTMARLFDPAVFTIPVSPKHCSSRTNMWKLFLRGCSKYMQNYMHSSY